MDTCCERADFLALLYVVFSCVLVTFPFDILGQVKYLVLSIPDFCLLPYCEYEIQYTDTKLSLSLKRTKVAKKKSSIFKSQQRHNA